MKYNKSLITYAFFGTFLMVFGVYSSTMQYANAVSVVTITFTAGVTTNDVTYRTDTSESDSTAYIVGAFGGVARVWKKAGSSQTIIGNVTLTGSSTARAIEYNEDNQFVYVATNDKFYKLTTNLGIAGEFATGTANIVRQMVYDSTRELMYFCTNDGYGTINTSTLLPSTIHSDPATNSVFGCALDELNNFMYVSGDNIGTGFTADIKKMDLNTNTQLAVATFASNFGFGVCYDDFRDKVWVTESSGAIVHKYDNNLIQETTVATGITPRFCSISTGLGAERLYIDNEGADTVTIIDTDSNTVLSTQSVCDLGVTTPKMDTKRLFNTTNTYIACPVATNSVIIDDTISESIPPNIIDGVNCDLPQNKGILTCDTTTGALTGASELFNQSATNLICQVALIPCTDFVPDNPDIKTNGVGYLLTAVAIAIFVSLLWIASRGSLTEIPTFVWFIGIIAVLGAITAIEWIDPTFLIIGIIVVSALATAKAKSVLGDSSLFKGES